MSDVQIIDIGGDTFDVYPQSDLTSKREQRLPTRMGKVKADPGFIDRLRLAVRSFDQPYFGWIHTEIPAQQRAQQMSSQLESLAIRCETIACGAPPFIKTKYIFGYIHRECKGIEFRRPDVHLS